jgi:hypothetical protein
MSDSIKIDLNFSELLNVTGFHRQIKGNLVQTHDQERSYLKLYIEFLKSVVESRSRGQNIKGYIRVAVCRKGGQLKDHEKQK